MAGAGSEARFAGLSLVQLNELLEDEGQLTEMVQKMEEVGRGERGRRGLARGARGREPEAGWRGSEAPAIAVPLVGLGRPRRGTEGLETALGRGGGGAGIGAERGESALRPRSGADRVRGEVVRCRGWEDRLDQKAWNGHLGDLGGCGSVGWDEEGIGG